MTSTITFTHTITPSGVDQDVNGYAITVVGSYLDGDDRWLLTVTIMENGHCLKAWTDTEGADSTNVHARCAYLMQNAFDHIDS